MVLWLGLDQKCQHLFTEVRIPEAGGEGGVKRREMQRKAEDKKS